MILAMLMQPSIATPDHSIKDSDDCIHRRALMHLSHQWHSNGMLGLIEQCVSARTGAYVL